MRDGKIKKKGSTMRRLEVGKTFEREIKTEEIQGRQIKWGRK